MPGRPAATHSNICLILFSGARLCLLLLLLGHVGNLPPVLIPFLNLSSWPSPPITSAGSTIVAAAVDVGIFAVSGFFASPVVAGFSGKKDVTRRGRASEHVADVANGFGRLNFHLLLGPAFLNRCSLVREANKPRDGCKRTRLFSHTRWREGIGQRAGCHKKGMAQTSNKHRNPDWVSHRRRARTILFSPRTCR